MISAQWLYYGQIVYDITIVYDVTRYDFCIEFSLGEH